MKSEYNQPATTQIKILTNWHDRQFANQIGDDEIAANPFLLMLADLALDASAIEFGKSLNEQTNPLDTLVWYEHEFDVAAKLELAIELLTWAQTTYRHGTGRVLQSEEVAEHLTTSVLDLARSGHGSACAGMAQSARLKARSTFLDKLTTRMRLQYENHKKREVQGNEFVIRNSKGEGFHYTTVKKKGRNVMELTFSNRARPMTWKKEESAMRWIDKAKAIDKTAVVMIPELVS